MKRVRVLIARGGRLLGVGRVVPPVVNASDSAAVNAVTPSAVGVPEVSSSADRPASPAFGVADSACPPAPTGSLDSLARNSEDGEESLAASLLPFRARQTEVVPHGSSSTKKSQDVALPAMPSATAGAFVRPTLVRSFRQPEGSGLFCHPNPVLGPAAKVRRGANSQRVVAHNSVSVASTGPMILRVRGGGRSLRSNPTYRRVPFGRPVGQLGDVVAPSRSIVSSASASLFLPQPVVAVRSQLVAPECSKQSSLTEPSPVVSGQPAKLCRPMRSPPIGALWASHSEPIASAVTPSRAFAVPVDSHQPLQLDRPCCPSVPATQLTSAAQCPSHAALQSGQALSSAGVARLPPVYGGFARRVVSSDTEQSYRLATPEDAPLFVGECVTISQLPVTLQPVVAALPSRDSRELVEPRIGANHMPTPTQTSVVAIGAEQLVVHQEAAMHQEEGIRLAPLRGAPSVLSGTQLPIHDLNAQAALKEVPAQNRPLPTESRAGKHHLIRPAPSRCGSAIGRDLYQRLVTSGLIVDAYPSSEKSAMSVGRKCKLEFRALRERVRRMLRQGIQVGTIFNVVSGLEEQRLIDKHGRMIVQHEEVLDVLNFLWEDGHRMDTNHTLRRRVMAQFSGIGPPKVEMFLAQQVSSSVRNFKVPHVESPRHILASRPMEHIQIDCTHLHSVEYLGTVVTGLITFIDIFSRFVFAWPIIAECTWEVCRAFMLFCSLYGAPEIVQTDHGTAFMGEMKTMAEQLYGCHVIHGRVRYPQSQGPVEKCHGKMKSDIIALTYEHVGDILRWPEMVPLAMRQRNNAGHALFNEELSPFTAFFGRADNKPLAADVYLVKGTYVQKSQRLQTLEQKQQARLASRVNIDHYVAGGKCYNVELCFQPRQQTTDEDNMIVRAGEDAQYLIDSTAAQDVALTDPRVGYTEHGYQLFVESGTVIRELLELHRMSAESLLRQRQPGENRDVPLLEVLRNTFEGDSTLRDCLQLYAHFSSGIRDAAAQFTVAYVESIDAGTRKKMPAPYQQNDNVWVLSLAEEPTLCRRYKCLWTSTTDRRLRVRLPGVIRAVDSSNPLRPYEVEVFVDGVRAAEENRTTCETAWLSGAALAPTTGLSKKIRSYGTLQQVRGLCVARETPTIFCLRRASDTCHRSLCEIHCSATEQGSCGAHRSNVPRLFTIAPK